MKLTFGGKSIRFKEGDVRPTHRDTMGVRGILLKNDDYVISMESFSPDEPVSTDRRVKLYRDLLIVTEKGMGKRTPLPEYPLQNRSGQGLKVSETTDKTGKVVAAHIIDGDAEEVIVFSSNAFV